MEWRNSKNKLFLGSVKLVILYLIVEVLGSDGTLWVVGKVNVVQHIIPISNPSEFVHFFLTTYILVILLFCRNKFIGIRATASLGFFGNSF